MMTLIVVYGNAWLTFGGMMGIGLKERPNGQQFGSKEGRYSINWMSSVICVVDVASHDGEGGGEHQGKAVTN